MFVPDALPFSSSSVLHTLYCFAQHVGTDTQGPDALQGTMTVAASVAGLLASSALLATPVAALMSQV